MYVVRDARTSVYIHAAEDVKNQILDFPSAALTDTISYITVNVSVLQLPVFKAGILHVTRKW